MVKHISAWLHIITVSQLDLPTNGTNSTQSGITGPQTLCDEITK